MDEQEMNQFWKKIVDTINDGLMFIGPDGSILMVNRAFEDLTGYSGQDAIGLSCDTLGCDACEKTLQTDRRAVWCKLFEPGQKDMKKCRCHIRRKDGSLVTVLKNATVLRDENQVVLGVVETLTDISELEKLDEKVHTLSRHHDDAFSFCGMVGQSVVMKQVFEMIRKAAQGSAPVIITGESGTGKELVANAIHLTGARRDGPFIQLNCAALNESVLESEMFGHARGAFTGAHASRIGRFEAADQGDFFLDEIGDMPLVLQTKLLRVLESGQFERVGEVTPLKTDVRVICATNKDLAHMMEKGGFRKDLFFRINVIPIQVPPLRRRREDLPLLVRFFVDRLNRETGRHIHGLSPEAMDRFMAYDWPGNVRELKNALEYAFVTAAGPDIRLADLASHFQTKTGLVDKPMNGIGDGRPGRLLRDEQQLRELVEALRQTRGNQTRAAGLLGISRVTVWNRMCKYGVDIHQVLAGHIDRPD